MQYATKQRKILLDTLKNHSDEMLSASQIIELVKNTSISRSAVYRNLSLLELSGNIKRITVTGTNKIYYRYCGSDECKEHLHLECSKCGKTFHMDISRTDSLVKNVMQDSKFKVDRASTVLHGICEKCQND